MRCVAGANAFVTDGMEKIAMRTTLKRAVVMLGEARQRNAKHEARLSNISNFVQGT
jgi:hypothetical protein